jgi:formate/nitrite transporter FocA (FNT family)
MAEKWMQDNAACLNEMNPIWWIVSGLVQALFYAILLHKFGVTTFKGGAIAGAWISLLMVLYFGIANASTFKAYTWEWLPIDLAGNIVSGAVAGGVIGWIFGKVK